ncbi:hypothetical protein [Rhizobium bangladeshense]|uniref:hypothetical protein n=1 Tax=Rhizobium bangladeshense TaxID=1138189 RepID=UPI0007E569E6|nr:hypothetical protein [Rhizobium bangladeshense]MBX4897126.1 hypothetical protein [Rhizobium bangladeshense]MBY3615845.1 hypothetical protein [Rhizobium bangladeshense]
MSLLKFFLKPARAMGRVDIVPSWKDDPLRHPEVERMSLRDIADLPLRVETDFYAEAEPRLAKCA